MNLIEEGQLKQTWRNIPLKAGTVYNYVLGWSQPDNTMKFDSVNGPVAHMYKWGLCKFTRKLSHLSNFVPTFTKALTYCAAAQEKQHVQLAKWSSDLLATQGYFAYMLVFEVNAELWSDSHNDQTLLDAFMFYSAKRGIRKNELSKYDMLVLRQISQYSVAKSGDDVIGKTEVFRCTSGAAVLCDRICRFLQDTGNGTKVYSVFDPPVACKPKSGQPPPLMPLQQLCPPKCPKCSGSLIRKAAKMFMCGVCHHAVYT